MILGFEDFTIIFTMLTPVYYVSYTHICEISKLKNRIYNCEEKGKEIEGI